MAKSVRLILNGKKAGELAIRQAVETVRAEGQPIDVQVTWESGDAARFAGDALLAGVDVIIAGGGDGTINEVLNGMLAHEPSSVSAMAAVPLGSANDFASGCGIPVGDPSAALQLAVSGQPTPIDVGRINDRYFVNALVMGFGAEVGFKTSDRMKRVLGGAAYHLEGFLTALRHTRYTGRVTTASGERMADMVFAAIGNGIQAGGVKLTARAKLNDGKLDLCGIPQAALRHLPSVLREVGQLEHQLPTLFRYEQLDWMEVESDQPIPISPDGEELITDRFRVEVLPRRLRFVLPPGAPLVGHG